MISLKPPKTNYESIDDIGRYQMIWNVCLVLVPIFACLGIIHVVFNDPSWLSSLLAFSVAIINLFILSQTRKYKLVAILSLVLGTLICQMAIFVIDDSRLIADTMWCILVGFFAFFMFGSLVGTVTLLLNLFGLLTYILNGSRHDILSKGISIEEVDYKMVINVIYVALALAFVINKMIVNNKETNRRYEEENKRNEILLKEIHHRVKNNLQIISSLLKLQAADCMDEKIEVEFSEAINRIRSMALIHEKMYTNDDLSKIDIESYLVALIEDITQTIQSETNLEVNVKSEIAKIDVKSIVPISLIFNELITNSLKHGFNGKNNGEIGVSIRRDNHTTYFDYFDNGEWKEPLNESTFGIELIRTLTSQLNGEYRLSIDGNTTYHFEFPIDQFYFEKK